MQEQCLWGSWGKEMTKAKRIELIETAYDVGISSFDHADIYGNYTTENDFGNAFSESGLSRDSVQFISKCGIAMVCENKPYKTKHYNYSSSYIIDAVHNSLRNLKNGIFRSAVIAQAKSLALSKRSCRSH